MRRYQPNRSALALLRLLIFCICAAGSFAAYHYLRAYPILMYVIFGLCAGLFVLAGLIILPVYFAQTRYAVSAEDISKTTGFFIFRKDYMLTESIQYLTTITIPFSRYTAFNFIIVNALGGKILLAFLKNNEVTEISAVLNHAIRKRSERDNRPELHAGEELITRSGKRILK